MTITIPPSATDEEIRQISLKHKYGICIYRVCRKCGFFQMSMWGPEGEIEVVSRCSCCNGIPVTS